MRDVYGLVLSMESLPNILQKTFGGFSVFGGLFTITSYYLFPLSRSPSQVYALWLAIAAVGYGSIPFLNHEDPIICKLTGFLDNYFYLTAIFTTAVIANCMKQIFLCGDEQHPYQARESIKLAIQPKNYLFVWVLPLLLNLLPLSTNHFGPVENGGAHLCWIKTDSSDIRRNHIGLIWMGVTMYIPLLLCFFFNASVYISIWQKVKAWKFQIVSPEINLKLGLALNRIAWYPVILIAVYIFPIIYRYGQFFGFGPAWLSIAASSVRLQGFLDAIAYGLTERVISRWIKFFQYWCCDLSDHAILPSPSHDASSSHQSPSDPSRDSSVLFPEGYLWERLVPSDFPASSHSSISDSTAYYTPMTSKDLPIPSRDRGYLLNPLAETKNYPYRYLYQQQG